MENDFVLRMASPDDAEELIGIYAPYVRETAISFEYEVPGEEEFRGRIEKTLERYPYIVAERGGRIEGYAYASSFHPRAAYGWSVETTVYVRRECRSSGVGRLLYTALERLLEKQNVLNLYACIAYPNPGSTGFHQHMGYRQIAHFTDCGFKLGRWWDMVWMEKMIGTRKNPPEPVVPVGMLDSSEVDRILAGE